MPNAADWIDSRVAPTAQALEDGDGCHEEEGQCLKDYLAGNISANEAAAAIIKPILNESDPPSETYRLWGLLADALAELKDERETLYNLLGAIQELGSQGPIDFSYLPGFGHMWADLYQYFTQGSMPWEKERDGITDEKMAEMRQLFIALGTIEATLYVRDIAGVPARWAWCTLNIVLSRRPGLDAYLGGIYGWLSVAGEKLFSDVIPDEVISLSRAVDGRRPDAQEALSQPMSEHIRDWIRQLRQLKSHNSTLSDEGKRLAAECDKLIRRETDEEWRKIHNNKIKTAQALQ